MFKFIRSNWREALALAIVFVLLLVAILALGSRSVSESAPLSAGISLLVTLVSGAIKFIACLALAWAGLAITFPEAARFTFGESFDVFWQHQPMVRKGVIGLVTAAVLSFVAGLCMAAS